MIRTASIFSLFCGIAIMVVWGVLLSTGQVIELQTSPFKTLFLLGAEFLTAVSLILSGSGLVIKKRWGLSANLAALGMLLYCTIFSIGVFGQAGNVPAAIFFGVIATMALVISARFVLGSIKGGSE